MQNLQSNGVHATENHIKSSEMEGFFLRPFDMNELRQPVKLDTQRLLDLNNTIIINNCVEEDCQYMQVVFENGR